MEARQIGTKRPRDSSEGNTVLGYAEFPGSVPGLLDGVIERKIEHQPYYVVLHSIYQAKDEGTGIYRSISSAGR